MLSAKYHILFWTISIFSIPVAILRHRFHAYLPSVLTDSCLENAVYSLTAYAIWKKKKGMWWLYIVTMGILCVGSEEIVTKLAFKGKMSGIDDFDEDGIRMLVAHGLVGFIVLGTVEPIMRDRRDIEIYGMGMHAEYPMLRGRRQSPTWVSIMGLLALTIMIGLIELALYVALDQWVDLPEFWFPEDLTLEQTFVHVWLLTPLLDIVETASYIVYRVAWPKGFQQRAAAIHNQP
ncbi:hypothetical protein EDB81DRAFT_777530 [Dactylonectria macrodidyma]|uniref:Uncharacterized protein n=1 Tax=Dactylonectria macrodidyma TaxID=307937 RepID=A0A9P9FR43_9HYPO|nr:hypothetical protein EDB81DRAFT_777530 [Dactylonectria macrodidyma]